MLSAVDSGVKRFSPSLFASFHSDPSHNAGRVTAPVLERPSAHTSHPRMLPPGIPVFCGMWFYPFHSMSFGKGCLMNAKSISAIRLAPLAVVALSKKLMHRSKLVFTFLAMLAWALAARPSDAQTLTTLASFNGTDGDEPNGSLTLIGSTLYGMTAQGGANRDGTIFSIPVTGGSLTTLHSFNGTDGGSPDGNLTPSGLTLYGMTSAGGSTGSGTIFSIPLAGGGVTNLASFNRADGASGK